MRRVQTNAYKQIIALQKLHIEQTSTKKALKQDLGQILLFSSDECNWII